MKVIHKMVLSQNRKQSFDLPSGAKIVHFGLQNGFACIWYECNPNTSWRDDYIQYTFLTGEDIDVPDDAEFLGTALFDGGAFVVHYYIWRGYDE